MVSRVRMPRWCGVTCSRATAQIVRGLMALGSRARWPAVRWPAARWPAARRLIVRRSPDRPGLRLVGARVALAAATVVTIAVPTLASFYVRQRHLVGDQVAPVRSSALTDDRRIAFTGFAPPRGRVFVVLGYHDIVAGRPRGSAPNLRRLSVPASRFDAQLRMLRLAGFQAVSAEEVRDALSSKKALPERAVLITFSAARVRAWSHADPILARYGYRATVFVDPSRTRDSTDRTLLTWPKLRAMVDTGRWSIGMSTPDAEATVPVDAAGRQASALVNYGWLGRERRTETPDEFRERVDRALSRAVRTLADRGVAPPSLLSYPLQPDYPITRVGGAFADLSGVVHRRFAAAVLTVEQSQAVTADWAGKRVLPRLEVYSSTTDELLFSRIQAAADTA